MGDGRRNSAWLGVRAHHMYRTHGCKHTIRTYQMNGACARVERVFFVTSYLWMSISGMSGALIEFTIIDMHDNLLALNLYLISHRATEVTLLIT